MGSEKMVSIVVPVYNVEKYLEKCVDSLLGQTYQNIEILLIDDGSTDMSGAICDKYADRDVRIRVLHKENGGVSSARNAGIDMVLGEYLIFVDADDWVHHSLVDTYMKYAAEDTILLCNLTTDEQMLDKDLQLSPESMMDSYERSGFMRFFGDGHVNSPADKLYNIEIIRKNGIQFLNEKNLGEDLMFNLDYFRYAPEKYQVIHPPLYYYRENRRGSLSTSYRTDLFEIQQELFKAVEKFLHIIGAWNTENQKIYFGIYWDRLYLTVKMCREYEKIHSNDRRLPEILRAPIWKSIWNECKEKKIINWKRRIKKLHLSFLFFVERQC